MKQVNVGVTVSNDDVHEDTWLLLIGELYELDISDWI